LKLLEKQRGEKEEFFNKNRLSHLEVVRSYFFDPILRIKDNLSDRTLEERETKSFLKGDLDLLIK